MEIELSARAEADLIEIADFIDKDNPSAPERYVRRLATGSRYCANFRKPVIVFEIGSNVRALVERPIKKLFKFSLTPVSPLLAGLAGA